jgi:E3 ubiquitin-protein ligase HERC3
MARATPTTGPRQQAGRRRHDQAVRPRTHPWRDGRRPSLRRPRRRTHRARRLGRWRAHLRAADTHQIKCWGSDYWGGLGRAAGTGLVELGTGRTAVAVAAGHGHTCALLDGGQVKCWRRNEFGQLGLGDVVDRGAKAGTMGDALPPVDLGSGRTAVGNTTRYGAQPGQMGDALPAAQLGANGRLRGFTGNTGHACALFDGGRLVCWGNNGQGQLGLGDTKNRGDSPDEIGFAMPSIDVGP